MKSIRQIDAERRQEFVTGAQVCCEGMQFGDIVRGCDTCLR